MFSHKVPYFLRIKLGSREYKVYNILVESLLILRCKVQSLFYWKKITIGYHCLNIVLYHYHNRVSYEQ